MHRLRDPRQMLLTAGRPLAPFRLLQAVVGSLLLLTVLGGVLASPDPTPAAPLAQGGLPGLHVSGNQLLDSSGKRVILRGVNYSGSEYACIQGWGIFDGPSDLASVQAMRGWGINAALLPLNEDCWLGINGVPAADGGANYQNAITNYVGLLKSQGIYPVLSYMWGAPGSQQALDHPAVPDADHATAFWQSVATRFGTDPAVVFRLQQEPHPAGGADTTAAWRCYRDGGSACSEGYTVVGMQSLLNTVRGTGAQNVVGVSGISWANSFTQFLTYRPTDSLNNLIAMADIYPNGNTCGSVSCYDTYYAPVAAVMPFMAGEFGESVDGNVCGVTASNTLLGWLDAHQSGYLAWVWNTWSTSCGDLSLITNFNGTAKSPNGTNYKAHLASVLGQPTSTPTATGAGGTATPTVASTATRTATTVPPTTTPTRTAVAASPTPTATVQQATATITKSPTPSSATPTRTPSPTVPTLTPTPTATVSTSGTLVVYDNAMAPAFRDGSFAYSSRNACDPAVYYSPACSYAITYRAWGGLNFQMASGTLRTTGYTSLQWKVNPAGQPITKFAALFTDASGEVINGVVLTASNATALGNGWYQVRVPITQLNPSNVAISEIQLKNATGGALPMIHIDDVMLQ